MLASLSGWAEHMLDTIGYAALGLLMLASPPIPSEVILPLAGFFVGRGELAFPLALAAATAGAVGNASIVYALARWGGRPLLLRGRILRIDEARIERAEHWLARYGARVVLFGRMMSMVRWMVGIPAGAGKMPFHRYVPLTAIGCAVWNTLLMSAGWTLGRNHGEAGHVVILGSGVLLVCGIAIAVMVVVSRRMRSLKAARHPH